MFIIIDEQQNIFQVNEITQGDLESAAEGIYYIIETDGTATMFDGEDWKPIPELED